MAEPIVTRRWLYRGLFVLLALTFVFLRLLPLGSGFGALPGPDLLTALAFAWVLRRPDYVPVTMVAALVLLTDILFLHPLGLWAALVVVGLEFLRQREPFSRDLPFALEWLVVASVLIAMTLAETLVLFVFMVDGPAFGQVLIQLLLTITCYPVVVLVTARVLGLRKVAPGEVDEYGHKV